MKKYIVYKHTNNITNKCYIGMTEKTLEQRAGKNGRKYRVNKKDGNYEDGKFFDSILYYGWMNYSHEILESNLTLEEAREKELYYIKLYNSLENGYNDAEGFKPAKGKTWTKNLTDRRKEELKVITSKQIFCDREVFLNIDIIGEKYDIPKGTIRTWLSNVDNRSRERKRFIKEHSLRYATKEESDLFFKNYMKEYDKQNLK